jgi:predicted ribosomally synthesized peptide with SipW-like signal peptide
MRKIIGLAIAALMLMALAGGGTLAFFSDTEDASGNQIQAGSIDLTPDTTHFFTTSAHYNNIKPGTTYDEYIILTPETGTTMINTDNYLSIQMKNAWVDQSGFLTLVGANKLHKLDGTAYVSGDVGDMGKGTKVVLWLSTSSSGTPAGTDIVLIPGLNGGTTGTFTSIFSSTTWSTIWSHGNITNYNYAGYFNKSSSSTATNTDTYSWNNVLGAEMGTTTWYFHVTYNFPNGDSTDNKYQAEKVNSDFYFTLATVNNPY